MKTRFAICLTGLILSVGTLPANADKGQTTYEMDCTGCHGSEVFTRPDRRIQDLTNLEKRVRQCSYAVEAKWFDEDIKAVTEYLNKTFYKF